MNRSLLARAAAGLVVVLGLAACSPAGAPEGSDPSTAVEGGDLVFVENSFGPPWAPHLVGPYEHSNLYANIADTLVYNDPEEGPVPHLAESWEVSDDGTTYTFTLREGVTFSDGTPLDAEAVKLNLDQIGLGDEGLGITPLPYFTGYVGSEVLDPLTVSVEWSGPNAYALDLLGIPAAAIVAASTVELPAAEQSRIENVIGSGPFVVDQVDDNEQVVLVKRDDYAWAPQTSPNQGAAYLDSLTIRYVGDSSLRSGALESGQAHIIRGVYPADEEALAAAGFEIDAVDASQSYNPYSITFRVDNPTVSDVRVREAITRGIDRESFVEGALTGSYPLAADVFGHTHPEFLDQSEKLAYDPDRAAELLDEAGWELGSDGVRRRDGETLRVTIASNQNQPFAGELGDYLVNQLAELGIEVENRAGDNSFIQYARSFDTGGEVAIHIGQGWIVDGLRNYGATKTFTNLAVDEQVAAWFLEQRAATDEAEFARLSHLQQERLLDEYWVAPIVDEVQVYGQVGSLHGVRTSTNLGTYFQSAFLAE